MQYVKKLLKYGTNPSITTRYGWAPLHWAANSGHIEVVKILIQAGADLSPISDQTVTPLDMAIRSKHSGIVDLLVQTGARESRDVSAEISASRPVKARWQIGKRLIPCSTYLVFQSRTSQKAASLLTKSP